MQLRVLIAPSMILQRREKPSLRHRARAIIWPHGGWLRFGRYIWYRLVRLPASPHSIAAGIAAGVAVCFTPFLGFHIIMASLVCLLLRGNVLAAALATIVGNPWTFPFMFSLTALVGTAIMGERPEVMVPPWSWSALFDDPFGYLGQYYALVEPLIWGSLPTAATMGLAIYFPCRFGLSRYKNQRLERLKARYAARMRGETVVER